MKQLPFSPMSQDRETLLVNASTCMWLSDLAYQDEKAIRDALDDAQNSKDIMFFSSSRSEQGFILRQGGIVFVVFRGTEYDSMKDIYEDWKVNLNVEQTPFSVNGQSVKYTQAF